MYYKQATYISYFILIFSLDVDMASLTFLQVSRYRGLILTFLSFSNNSSCILIFKNLNCQGADLIHFQDFNAEVLRCLTIPNVKVNLFKD